MIIEDNKFTEPACLPFRLTDILSKAPPTAFPSRKQSLYFLRGQEAFAFVVVLGALDAANWIGRKQASKCSAVTLRAVVVEVARFLSAPKNKDVMILTKIRK